MYLDEMGANDDLYLEQLYILSEIARLVPNHVTAHAKCPKRHPQKGPLKRPGKFVREKDTPGQIK